MKTTDFEVRPLDEYSTDDLQMLLFAVSYTLEQSKKQAQRSETVDSMDIWGYRINQALKNRRNMILAGYEETDLTPI